MKTLNEAPIRADKEALSLEGEDKVKSKHKSLPFRQQGLQQNREHKGAEVKQNRSEYWELNSIPH